jgi:hypothetical protein
LTRKASRAAGGGRKISGDSKSCKNDRSGEKFTDTADDLPLARHCQWLLGAAQTDDNSSAKKHK